MAEQQPVTTTDILVQDTKVPEEVDVDARTWDPKFVKKVKRKVDLLIVPLVCFTYLAASLDKSNLGNAKKLGMLEDIGGDEDGSKYAFLNSLYFIGYAPLMVPFALLGKRTRVSKVIAACTLYWGIASACTAAVNSYGAAEACRFMVGMGEAGFSPLIPFYLARWYTRKDLATRVALWLFCAPIGGFVNGLIAYGAAKMHTSVAPWRVLFIIEGVLTVVIGIFNFIILPEDIVGCRWFSPEEKEYLLEQRAHQASTEKNRINWRHARGAFYRWQQIIPPNINSTLQISGAALSAFLPTLAGENGFKGATAQIATLAPYGSAAGTIIVALLSDRYQNRGWFTGFGLWLCVIGFGIYLGSNPTMHAARFAALIFAEVGHYVSTGTVCTWAAENSGSESRRAVTVPFTIATAQALAIASGYLFPKSEGPKYTRGSAICLGLSLYGTLMTFLYQFLLARENRKRDERDGVPSPDVYPDTETYADDAKGFRYQL